MRRKVVNRVKFKSTEIRLAFKALSSVFVPPVESSRPPRSRKLRINRNEEGEGAAPRRARQLNLRYEIKFPLLTGGRRGDLYTLKLGARVGQIDKPRIVARAIVHGHAIAPTCSTILRCLSLSLCLACFFFCRKETQRMFSVLVKTTYRSRFISEIVIIPAFIIPLGNHRREVERTLLSLLSLPA